MSPMATLFHLALMLSIYPLFASITITHDSCKNLLMRWLNLRMTLYETVSLDGKSCPLSVRILDEAVIAYLISLYSNLDEILLRYSERGV